MTPARFGVLIRSLAVGLAGGGAFHALGMPLPWVMGAMAATIAAGAAGHPGYMPRSVRNGIIPALGVLFGSAIDLETIESLPRLWVLVPVTVVYLAVIIAAGCLYFTRVARLDLATAYFASVPGSFSEMIFIAEDRNADLGSVAIVHSTRLVVSLTLITFGFRVWLGIDTTQAPNLGTAAPGIYDLSVLAACAVGGYFGGRALRLPSAHLFGPLILSAAAHVGGLVEGAPPGWTIALAQVFIGIFIGLRFAGMRLAAVRVLLSLSLVWALFLLGVAVLAAEVAVAWLGLPFAAAFLSFAPGGAVEISVVALAAGVSLGFVALIQFLRISLTVLLAPLAFRLLAGPGRRR